MRKILLLIFVFTCFGKNNINAQNWAPLGTGLVSASNYGGGEFISSAIYNGELYAGGVFDSAGDVAVSHIAKWNGTNWSNVGSGVTGWVRAMAVYNGELYAGGVFDSAGGIAAKNIAKWNGANWSSVSSGANSMIIDFVVYNGELHAAGVFDTIGGIAANRIAKWNGTNWSPVGEGIDPDWYVDRLTAVYSLTVLNGILYAGGDFDTAGTVPANNIAKWDGSKWSALNLGLGGGIVYSLAGYNGDIYAGGNFWRTGGNDYVNHIARWNGTNWSTVGEGTDFASAALAVYNGILYAGGFYQSYNDGTGDGVGEYYPSNYIAKWNGTYWSGLGRGVNGSVFDLLATDSALYVGGVFTYADTFPANRIAKWLGNCSNPSRPDTIYGNKSICAGSTQSYFINEVPSATYYTWVLPADWPGYSTTDSITTIAYYDGEHIISVIANNGCGNSPPQTLAITAVRFPSPDNIHGNISPCPGSTQTYFVDPVQGATSYSWNLPPGWSGNSTTNSITVTAGSIPGFISVSVNSNCGSSIAQELEVIVNSGPPQPGLIIGADSVCQGTMKTYSVNPVIGATSYTWNLPAGWSGISNSNSITIQAGLNGGSLSVVANNNCGASVPQTKMLTTNSIPAKPAIIYGNNTVCEGSSQTYFIDPVIGATGYAWDLTFGTSFGFNTTSITITAHHSGYPDDFITVSAYNNCGNSDMLDLPVNVDLLPYAPNSITGKNSVCRGSRETYFINPVPGATNYTWTLPSGWVGSSTTSTISVTTGNETGKISVRANNSCGSGPFTSLSILPDTIVFKPVDIQGNIYVNTGQSHSYSVDLVTGVSGFNWSLSGGGNITGGQNTGKVNVNWQTPGTYILSVTAVNSCGVAADQMVSIKVSAPNIEDPYSLQLFPNPSSGQFCLKAKRVQDKVINVEVVNMAGQFVFRSGKKQGVNDYTQLINLDKMPQGIYVVKIMVDDKVYVRSIVINN